VEEKIPDRPQTDKGLLFRIYKELLHIIRDNPIQALSNQQPTLKKEERQMANKQSILCLTCKQGIAN
jgi:hypothetical protein